MTTTHTKLAFHLVTLVVIALLAFWIAPQLVEGSHNNWNYGCVDPYCDPADEAAAASACAAQGGGWSYFYVPSGCEGMGCFGGGGWGTCDIPHAAPTCATQPDMDGCPCTKANACNTTSGSYSGGNCTAPEPAACPPTCTPDTSCAASTCPFDTCTATAADCSTYEISGSNWGACFVPTCANGSPGPYPDCPLSCTPDTSCAASTCPTDTCTATASDCSTYAISGSNPGACGASCTPDTSCAASTCPTDTCTATASDCSTYAISGSNWGACGAGDPPATATLTANPTTIALGGSSTLTWSSTDADSCTGGGFSTGGATSGTRSVSPSSTVTYTVSCTGSGGSDTDDATVTVTGASCSNGTPLVLTATPSRIQPGANVTLSWNGSDLSAGSCTLTNLNTGAIEKTTTVASCSMSDSKVISGLSAQTSYRLTCGALAKDLVVNLVPRFEEF